MPNQGDYSIGAITSQYQKDHILKVFKTNPYKFLSFGEVGIGGVGAGQGQKICF